MGKTTPMHKGDIKHLEIDKAYKRFLLSPPIYPYTSTNLKGII